MRSILLVSSSFGYGGAERSLEIILKHLAEPLRVGILAESPLHIERVAAIARPNTEIAVARTDPGPNFDAAVETFLRLYRALSPVSVLANTQDSARILAAASGTIAGLARQSFIYVRDFQWQRLDRIFGTLPEAAILVPHRVVLQRPDYLDRWVAPAGPCRAIVVPDMVEIEPAVADADSDAAGEVVLHLATINPWKGHTHLIDAMARVKAAGAPLRVHSFGFCAEPSIRDALHDNVAALDLDDTVVLSDYIADPRPWLRDCLCVAVTAVSHSGGPETFGRTVIEAWAHAKPVVAFAAGAPAHMIRHDVDGLLVPEGDDAALAAALMRLHRSPDFARRLGRNGFRRAQAEFEAAHVVAHLQSLLEKPSAPGRFSST